MEIRINGSVIGQRGNKNFNKTHKSGRKRNSPTHGIEMFVPWDGEFSPAVDALFLKGLSLMKLGKHDAATEYFDRYFNLFKTKGTLLAMEGKHSEAIGCFDFILDSYASITAEIDAKERD